MNFKTASKRHWYNELYHIHEKMVLKSCRTKFQKMKISGKVGVRIKRKEIEEYKKAVKTNRIKYKRLSLFWSLSNDYHIYNKSMSVLQFTEYH